MDDIKTLEKPHTDWPQCCDGEHLKATAEGAAGVGPAEGYGQVIPIQDAPYRSLECPACRIPAFFSVQTYVDIESTGVPFRVETYTDMTLPLVIWRYRQELWTGTSR